MDSNNLEQASKGGFTTVCTDGGRYDVNLNSLQRTSVYWSEGEAEVRRCTWFYKGTGKGEFIPYDINTAEKLEVISVIWFI